MKLNFAQLACLIIVFAQTLNLKPVNITVKNATGRSFALITPTGRGREIPPDEQETYWKCNMTHFPYVDIAKHDGTTTRLKLIDLGCFNKTFELVVLTLNPDGSVEKAVVEKSQRRHPSFLERAFAYLLGSDATERMFDDSAPGHLEADEYDAYESDSDDEAATHYDTNAEEETFPTDNKGIGGY